jgi:group I intron endonuclease
MKTNCVIYKITNNITGKVYIGKTVQKFETRCKGHKYKSCTALNNSIKTHGWDNFTKEIIFICFNESDLASMEEYFIKYYNSMVPSGYNIISIDKGLNRYTQETKDKISTSRYKYLSKLETPLVAVNKKEHIVQNDIECKMCADCNQIKPLNDFGKNSRRWDGLHMYCKPCWINYNKKYKLAKVRLTPEELKESYKKRTPKMRESLINRYKKNGTNV